MALEIEISKLSLYHVSFQTLGGESFPRAIIGGQKTTRLVPVVHCRQEFIERPVSPLRARRVFFLLSFPKATMQQEGPSPNLVLWLQV